MKPLIDVIVVCCILCVCIGTVERDSAKITVKYSSGEYCLRLFDHVKVRVVVEQSHAHGYSIGLLLLSCQPIRAESLKGYTPRQEVVRVSGAQQAKQMNACLCD